MARGPIASESLLVSSLLRTVVLAAVWLGPALCARGQTEPPLDPIQRSLIDSLDASLGLPSGRTPEATGVQMIVRFVLMRRLRTTRTSRSGS